MRELVRGTPCQRTEAAIVPDLEVRLENNKEDGC